MDYIVSALEFNKNAQIKYSSSYTKGDILGYYGRSASIFRISTSFGLNP
jgi:hypothetical protein